MNPTFKEEPFGQDLAVFYRNEKNNVSNAAVPALRIRSENLDLGTKVFAVGYPTDLKTNRLYFEECFYEGRSVTDGKLNFSCTYSMDDYRGLSDGAVVDKAGRIVAVLTSSSVAGVHEIDGKRRLLQARQVYEHKTLQANGRTTVNVQSYPQQKKTALDQKMQIEICYPINQGHTGLDHTKISHCGYSYTPDGKVFFQSDKKSKQERISNDSLTVSKIGYF